MQTAHPSASADASGLSDLAAIDRLRLVAARFSDCSPPGDDLAAWLADSVKRYVRGAPFGLTLAQAFGLELAAGERPWWTLEELAQRDRRIRELAARHFPGLPARAQARGIRGRRDLMRQLHASVSEATLRRVLAHETPPFGEPDRAQGSRP